MSLVVCSHIVGLRCHMLSRTTGKRKCKETLTQVRERVIREQAIRTNNRVRELLSFKEEESDSESEGSEDNSIDEDLDSLSLVRRDLYLGLLCLLLLVVLQSFWISSTYLRK